MEKLGQSPEDNVETANLDNDIDLATAEFTRFWHKIEAKNGFIFDNHSSDMEDDEGIQEEEHLTVTAEELTGLSVRFSEFVDVVEPVEEVAQVVYIKKGR